MKMGTRYRGGLGLLLSFLFPCSVPRLFLPLFCELGGCFAVLGLPLLCPGGVPLAFGGLCGCPWCSACSLCRLCAGVVLRLPLASPL